MDLNIKIKEPCPEKWESMLSDGHNRYCEVCSKRVFDFTTRTNDEIVKVLQENKSLCGRIPAQKNAAPPIVIKPETILSIKTSYAKITRIFIILICLNLTISCQDGSGTPTEKPVILADQEINTITGVMIAPPEFRTDTNNVVMQNGAYLVVDEMPEFMGGSDSLKSFVQRHIAYPKEKAKEPAKIYVSFIINEKGRVTQPRIEYKSCENSKPFEKEVLRMLKKMPRWIPGKLNGTKVPVKMTLPVDFRLE